MRHLTSSPYTDIAFISNIRKSYRKIIWLSPLEPKHPISPLNPRTPKAFQTSASAAISVRKTPSSCFFPLAFTGVCTTELCDVTAGLGQYSDLNADVIGISVDSPFAQEAWAQKENIGITLASDLNKKTAADYGVLLDDLLGFEPPAPAPPLSWIRMGWCNTPNKPQLPRTFRILTPSRKPSRAFSKERRSILFSPNCGSLTRAAVFLWIDGWPLF